MECVFVGFGSTSFDSKSDYPVVREAFLLVVLPLLSNGRNFIVGHCQVHVTGASAGLEGYELAVFIDDVLSVAYDDLFK
jgi:hypothetical protein